MRFLYAIITTLALTMPAIGDDDVVLPPMKLTGTVVSNDGRFRESAIIEDKIWFVGQQYYINHGSLQYPVSRVSPNKPYSPNEKLVYNPKFDKGDIAVLVSVYKGLARVLYRNNIYVITKDGTIAEDELLEEVPPPQYDEFR